MRSVNKGPFQELSRIGAYATQRTLLACKASSPLGWNHDPLVIEYKQTTTNYALQFKNKTPSPSFSTIYDSEQSNGMFPTSPSE